MSDQSGVNHSIHTPGGGLARGYLILAAVFFPLGITQPVLETSRFFFFKDQYSILETIQALWRTEEIVLAALIFLFSIITPLLKMIVTALISWRVVVPGPGTAQVLESLGKWSLADVFIVAIAIVIWSTSGVGTAASQTGIWLFATSAVFTMLASGQVVRALR